LSLEDLKNMTLKSLDDSRDPCALWKH